MITAVILQYILNFVIGIIELLLGFRLILKLFGANPATPFVNWIYETSEPLIGPFRGMFPHPVIDGQFVIEFSTLFALFIYALIGYLVAALINFIHFSTARYYKKR